MRIIGVIPARSGSKGIPNKNIKLLKGKPLIAYTIEAAISSNLDRVLVTTDCKNIADISKHFGAEVMIRSPELARDDTPTLPVVQDVINSLDSEFDAVMTLQPTSPLRKTEDINESITIFNDNIDADSLVSVVKVDHNFMPEKLMSLKGKFLHGVGILKRRQEITTRYARNGAAIYITKTNILKKCIIGGKILPYFMSKSKSIDIDDTEDWNIVEKLI